MRIPRKSALGVLLLVPALAILAVSATAGTDTENGVTQSLEVTPSKTKVLKKPKNDQGTNIKLNTDVEIDTADSGQPPAANLVKIGFANQPASAATRAVKGPAKAGFIFNDTGIPQCNPSKVEDKSIAEATAACKKSKVGSGSSIAACNLPPPLNGEFPGQVVAFNGKHKGKNKTIILHANTDLPTGPVALTLIGTLDKQNVLTVPVEPLGGGACSIKQFETTVGKTTKVDGEKEYYVSAVCPKGNWHNTGEFNFNSNSYGVTRLDPVDDIACTA
jgi:hypothetical protein